MLANKKERRKRISNPQEKPRRDATEKKTSMKEHTKIFSPFPKKSPSERCQDAKKSDLIRGGGKQSAPNPGISPCVALRHQSKNVNLHWGKRNSGNSSKPAAESQKPSSDNRRENRLELPAREKGGPITAKRGGKVQLGHASGTEPFRNP